MSTETEKDVNIPPSPLPDRFVYFWLALLEGVIAFSLVLFTIGLLESGGIIPDVLPGFMVSIAAFVAVTIGMFVLRLYRGGYVDF